MNKDVRGFTLIEMMVTVSVLAVMSMVAVPAFMSWLPQMRLNGASRQVMTDLMSARMDAVKNGNPFQITVLDSYRYQILNDTNNNGVADTGEDVSIKDLRDNYPGVTLSANPNTLTFSHRGTGVERTITLTEAGSGETKLVRTNITGRVRIE